MTVERLLREMSSREIAEWQALARLERDEARRADLAEGATALAKSKRQGR